MKLDNCKIAFIVLIFSFLSACAMSPTPLSQLSIDTFPPRTQTAPPREVFVAGVNFPNSVPTAPETPTFANTKTSDFILQKVFFATDRQKIKISPLKYGGKQESMSYGYSLVSIPEKHKVGEIESPTIWKFELSPNPKKHMVVMGSHNLSKINFLSDVSNTLTKYSKRKIFIFVHGYNVKFEDAIKRTAQMAHDLKFKGAPILYSWPSNGDPKKYFADEQNTEKTQHNLQEFIIDVSNYNDADEIYFIAHSMGNRPLTRALADIEKSNTKVKSKIKEIILAAPDLDASTFKSSIAPFLNDYSDAITIYASDNDRALIISQEIHEDFRLGQTAGFTPIEGIEMIDATLVGTDFLSHSYFSENEKLISDISGIISRKGRAKNRNGLSEINTKTSKTYWQFKK